MVKPEWGTKRTCPKCGTRFYDLAKESPVTCINCGVQWEPEPVLKSKQPLPFDAPKPEKEVKRQEDADLVEELDIIEDEEPARLRQKVSDELLKLANEIQEELLKAQPDDK